MKTEIYVSEICGLCYGSSTAINKTRDILKTNNNVVIYKELLHNKNVMQELNNNGAILKNELDELTSNDLVIIRAHGEPYSTFEFLKENNISFTDCTCPNVKAIHLLVKNKGSLGYKIIIVGKLSHPEVFATRGWCNDAFVIEEEKDILSIDLSFDKYYLVCQTTFSKDKAQILIKKIENLMNDNNKVFEYKNTICNAQKNINNAAVKLANKVDIMIVIGGKNSSNSRELFNNINRIKETYFIEEPNSVIALVKNNALKKGQKIGITAGASTMKEDILKVKTLLENSLK